MKLSTVLLIILVVLIIVLIFLYFQGRKMQKKQAEGQAQLDAAKNQIDAGYAELESAAAELAAGKAEIEQHKGGQNEQKNQQPQALLRDVFHGSHLRKAFCIQAQRRSDTETAR